jgi:hypothetical protein
MKRIILTEIILLFLIVCISAGLYLLIFGVNLRNDTYMDVLTFELRRTTIILEIIGIFILPIHILLNISRQIYFKFQKHYLAIEILIVSIILTGILFYKYLFLSTQSKVMANEGWTIYPPLTGLSVLDEHDPVKLQNEQNHLLVAIILILIVSSVLTFVTFRRQKSTRA